MNSEIKFKGKSIETEEFVYGDLFHDKDCFGHITASYIYEYDNAHGRCFQFEVDPNTVGQYIGLPDKNSEDVFKGDILHCDCWDIQIVWDNNNSRFGYLGVDWVVTQGNSKEISLEMLSKFEVIGNIHDNKETEKL